MVQVEFLRVRSRFAHHLRHRVVWCPSAHQSIHSPFTDSISLTRFLACGPLFRFAVSFCFLPSFRGTWHPRARQQMLVVATRLRLAAGDRWRLAASPFSSICRRGLGSWAGKFDTARGASLEARQALGSQLADVWVLHQDGEEEDAMAKEAGMDNQLAFALSVEGTAVGFIRGSLLDQNTGLLIGATCHEALSLSSVGVPLVRATRNELKLRGAKNIVAVAPLHGLCADIVASKGWERLEGMPGFEAEHPGAVEAVARGVPRPGHSVLGQGTFKAAEPAFKHLALEFAAKSMTNADSEVAMYGAAGAQVIGINWMHATDEAALRECAGCTVTMRFPS